MKPTKKPTLTTVYYELLQLRRWGEALVEGLRAGLEAGKPRPFVCALVRGKDREGRWVSFGASSDTDETLTLSPLMDLADCEVTVFADLRRVAVTGIYVGTWHVHGAPGECPSGFVGSWPMGVIGRVLWQVRK